MGTRRSALVLTAIAVCGFGAVMSSAVLLRSLDRAGLLSTRTIPGTTAVPQPELPAQPGAAPDVTLPLASAAPAPSVEEPATPILAAAPIETAAPPTDGAKTPVLLAAGDGLGLCPRRCDASAAVDAPSAGCGCDLPVPAPGPAAVLLDPALAPRPPAKLAEETSALPPPPSTPPIAAPAPVPNAPEAKVRSQQASRPTRPAPAAEAPPPSTAARAAARPRAPAPDTSRVAAEHDTRLREASFVEVRPPSGNAPGVRIFRQIPDGGRVDPSGARIIILR